MFHVPWMDTKGMLYDMHHYQGNIGLNSLFGAVNDSLEGSQVSNIFPFDNMGNEHRVVDFVRRCRASSGGWVVVLQLESIYRFFVF